MARSFSRAQKNAIRARLHEAGLKRFTTKGVRATRVDDLARDAGIAKGSFYGFFSSKEELFMAIAEQRDANHKTDMRAFLETHQGSAEARAGGFFDMVLNKIQTDPVLQLVIEHGELEYLMRRISPERLATNHRDDRAFVHKITRTWQKQFPDSAVEADIIEGLMSLMVALHLQHKVMPPAALLSTTALLRDIFVERLTARSAP